MENANRARGQFFLLSKHLCSYWLCLLQMLSHLVHRKCLYNMRNKLSEEAFCVIGWNARLLTDSLLYTLTLDGRDIYVLLGLVLRFPWSVHFCLHITVQMSSNWSHRLKNRVVHNRTSAWLGPFSRCVAGSFITKRISYRTDVSIERILDTQTRLKDHCVALESHAGALSN